MLVAVTVFGEVKEKILDPRISLSGRVVDDRGWPVAGAAVEWRTWRDRNSWRYDVGKDITNEWGFFHINEKGMRGDGITIHRISATGYRTLAEPRSFRYFKNPWRVVPNGKKSSTFVLKRRLTQ